MYISVYYSKNLKLIKMLILTIVLIFFGTVSGQNPKVKLNDGIAEGYFLKTINGRTISAFEGIPYAKPPIGDLRFQPPQPIGHWDGVWKAKTLYTCLQYDHVGIPAGHILVKGDEDCLYVNVYAPTSENLKNLDVIVYIHGGAFMFNNPGLHRPDYIMDKNIVFVTLGYRLGPLGFLSTEDEVVPGNNGLRDQNLALKWVKNNIEHFGGNPNSITIVGMSAGGASVHLHTLSPLSRGLFHKAFAQSGVITTPWALVENSREKAFKLGDLVGCPTTNSKDLIKCLKKRPAFQIVRSVQHFQPWLYNPFSPFAIVIDKWAKEPVLPEHPLTIMQKKQNADVPAIFSFVSCEGLYPASDFASHGTYLNELDSRWNEILPFILHYNYTIPNDQKNFVSQKIRDFYLQNEAISYETFPHVVDMVSDRIFVKNIKEVAQEYATINTSPVYMYKFSYLGTKSAADKRSLGRKIHCTSHADDTLYVIPYGNSMRSTTTDSKMSDILIDLWVSFAKTGTPTVENVNWTPLPKERKCALEYLHLVSPENIKMESADDVGNEKFWNAIPFMENENLLKKKDEL